MPDEKSPPPIGHPQRRVADPAVIEMRDTLARVEGELKGVIGHLCPLERVSAHEERMAAAEERMLAFDVRATALDTRLTTIGGAVTDVRQSVQSVHKVIAEATSVERSERGLWLGQLGERIKTLGDGITQAIVIMGDRITDQAQRMDRIGVKLENVMECNRELLEHQQNGLASAIATAVSATVTGEAQAHRIEVEADAQMVIAQAAADAKKNPWYSRLLDSRPIAIVPITVAGWMLLAIFVTMIVLIDKGAWPIIIDFMRHMLGGGE